MPDLNELLTEEAQRQIPDGVPPFDRLLSRARRRRRYRRGAAVSSALAVVSVIVAVVVTVFGGDGENVGRLAKPSPTRSPADAVVLLPTDHWRPGDAGLQALISGKLIIASEGRSACAWIGSQQSAVLWPEGYGVRLHPRVLVDPAGRVVAREGDRIAVGGGGMPATEAGPCNQKGQWTVSVESDVRVLN